ncbi:MAG: response regulator transcription factor, partial [Bacteroidales bacterium]|nr:response regulator transcription factor [Bacteroidales bacterium]
MQNKILVIDEDISNCQAIKNGLEKDGFIVDTAQDIDEASSFDLPSYSLMIIEVLLNRVSGFDFAKRLKNNDETCNIPFIFCTSLGDEEDIILGLNIGADDYIVKPFSMGEFCARVRSVIRRNTISVELKQKMKAGMFEPNIVMKDLRIDRNRKMAFVSG